MRALPRLIGTFLAFAFMTASAAMFLTSIIWSL